MIKKWRVKCAEWRTGFIRSSMPKVRFPRVTRFLQATGCLRVRVVGIYHAKNEWIYTSQFRWWHPLTWFLFIGFAAAEGFLAAPQFFSEKEWRVHNG